eukprot:gene52652-63724_t
MGKSVCPYEKGDRLIATRTFPSDSGEEHRETIKIGMIGVIDHVSADSDGHPQDIYVKFEDIPKEQWIFRCNQNGSVSTFPQGQVAGTVLSWSANSPNPWGFVKGNKDGEKCHLRLDAILRGKEEVGVGSVVRYTPQQDSKGMSAMNAVVLGSAEVVQFIGHVLRFNAEKGFGFLTSTDVEHDIFFQKKTGWKSRQVEPVVGLPVEFSLEEGIGNKPPHAVNVRVDPDGQEKKFHQLPGGKGGKLHKGGKGIVVPAGKGDEVEKGLKGPGNEVDKGFKGSGKGYKDKGWGGKGDKQDVMMLAAQFSGTANAAAFSEFMNQ